jgi:hypothetical protein
MVFRKHFVTGRHVKVPDSNTIKNWIQKFQTTTSVINKKPGSSVRIVQTPESADMV